MNNEKVNNVQLDTIMQIKTQEWLNDLRERKEFGILKAIRDHIRYLVAVRHKDWISVDRYAEEDKDGNK